MSNELLLNVVAMLGGGGVVAAVLNFIQTTKKDTNANLQELLNDFREEVQRKDLIIKELETKNEQMAKKLEIKNIELNVANSTYIQELMRLEQSFNEGLNEIIKIKNIINNH